MIELALCLYVRFLNGPYLALCPYEILAERCGVGFGAMDGLLLGIHLAGEALDIAVKFGEL